MPSYLKSLIVTEWRERKEVQRKAKRNIPDRFEKMDGGTH